MYLDIYRDIYIYRYKRIIYKIDQMHPLYIFSGLAPHQDQRVVDLFKKIESLRSQLQTRQRLRSPTGAFARWDDVSDIWNDAEVAVEDGTKVEIAAMEEHPEASPSEDGTPNYLLSPCLTRKRKAETKTPEKSKGRGKADDLSPRCGSDVKDKGFEAMMQQESRNSFSSGRSQKRKALDSLQHDIREMEKKLDNKPGSEQKGFSIEHASHATVFSLL